MYCIKCGSKFVLTSPEGKEAQIIRWHVEDRVRNVPITGIEDDTDEKNEPDYAFDYAEETIEEGEIKEFGYCCSKCRQPLNVLDVLRIMRYLTSFIHCKECGKILEVDLVTTCETTRTTPIVGIQQVVGDEILYELDYTKEDTVDGEITERYYICRYCAADVPPDTIKQIFTKGNIK